MVSLRHMMVCGLLLVTAAGCSTVEISTRSLDVPVSFTGTINKKFTVVKHFRKEQKAWFFFFGLVKGAEPDFGALLREEIQSAHGSAVANVTVQGETSLTDGAVSVVLGGLGLVAAPPLGLAAGYLVGARTYTIEGDVVQYQE